MQKSIYWKKESIIPCCGWNWRWGGVVLIVFADFPFKTTFERQNALFGVGRKCGVEHPGDELCQACLVIEVWISKDLSRGRPSQDPKRKEALGAWVLNIDGKTVNHEGYMAEIIRSGNSINLLEYDKVEVSYNKVMMAFLAGFASKDMSNAELHAMAIKYMGEK
jgi:hypothetical protein